jgi:hypothetical protein
VYNVRGQRVRELLNEVRSEGFHYVVWDGTNDFGLPLGSGLYFHVMKAGDFTETKKMLLLK